MRAVTAPGFWSDHNGLFNFADFVALRENLHQTNGSDGAGRAVGGTISSLASMPDVVGDLIDDRGHGIKSTTDSVTTYEDPAFAPSGKGKPTDSGSGSGGGNGGGNGGGKKSGTTTNSDGSTTDSGTVSSTGSTDSGSTTNTTTTSSDSGSADSFSSDAPQYALDALMSGTSWGVGTTVVKYAFLDALPSYYGTGADEANGFKPFSSMQQQATLEILDNLSQFTNVTFVASTVAESNIAFGTANLGSGIAGWAYYPTIGATGSISGDVWIDDNFMSPNEGNFAYLALLHEIGHAMGLAHPFEGAVTLPAAEDTRQYTVESYSKHATMGGVEPQTYMTYDIAALQELYGANMSWASGDDVYDFSTAHNLIETVWDSGGIDTFDASGRSDGVILDLNAGSFSSVGTRGTTLANENVAIAYNVVIENAVGSSGDDQLIGNAVDNVLTGGAGNDFLLGGGGRDLFRFDLGCGSDAVGDFEDGLDLLDFTATGLSFADLLISGDASSTTMSFGTDSVILNGFDVSWLDQGDFLFN